MSRVVLLVLLVAAAAPGGARSEEGSPPTPIVAECSPTWSAWYVPPGAVAPAQAPGLAVVDTDLRPGHVRLYLDGRYIGLADDFDGYPDYLYLQAGEYLLEGRLGGYRAVAFSLRAEPGCAFTLRHRLDRAPGSARVRWWDAPEEVAPGVRLFGPASVPPPATEAAPVPAPDPALRPDLVAPRGGETRPGVRLAVSPLEAAVYLDGHFVGQAREVNQRTRPLPVDAGPHRLEVMAPGYETHRRELEVAPGEVLEVVVVLERR